MSATTAPEMRPAPLRRREDGRDPGRGADTAALPVAVDVEGRLGGEVRRHVEGVLGWQVVDADTAALVPPALRLVCAATTAPTPTAVPGILLVDADLDPVSAARAGARHGTSMVLAWPQERDRLVAAASDLLADPGHTPLDTEVLRVAGAGGGVGTSTVALALAGLAGWHGLRVLALAGPGAPIRDVRRISADAVGAHDLLRRASPLPAVAGASVVRVDGVVGDLDPTTAGAQLVVVDAGRSSDADVLVCRPDRVALEHLDATTAGVVVINGEGPVPARVLARAAAGRVRVALPDSARVARAGLLARVPGALPGSWLRRLEPLVVRPGPGTCGSPESTDR